MTYPPLESSRSTQQHGRGGLERSFNRLRLVPIVGVVFGVSWFATVGGCRWNDGRMHDRSWEASDRPRSEAEPRLAKDGTAGTAPLGDATIQPGSGRRHVIIMIGDGMQLAHEVATSRYLYGKDYALAFHGFPVQTYKTTWDIDVYDRRADALSLPHYSPERFNPMVGYDPSIGGQLPYPRLEDNDLRRSYFLDQMYHPDSASTATAMSTGTKTYSSAIAWRPGGVTNGAIEESPAMLRRFYGMAVGFVTTVPFSHATPAGFFAHNEYRGNYLPIAHELFASVRPEVMIGGAWQNSTYYDPADLDQLIASDDYVFVHRDDGVDANQTILAAAVQANQSGKRLLGLFGGGEGTEGNFPSPVPVDSPGNPKVNRGSIDSPTLAAASIAALEVLARDPEGFFLLIEQGDIDWSNHTNNFARMVGCVSDLDSAVRAVVEFVDRPSDDVDWTNTLVIVTADHANSYMRFVKPLYQGDLPAQDGATYPDGEITYGTGTHTAELIAVYAKGFAAERLHDYETVYPTLGIIDDTSIYRVTMDAAKR